MRGSGRFALLLFGSCLLGGGLIGLEVGADTPPGGAAGMQFIDRSATHLPSRGIDDSSMDASAADLDGDGDLDLLIAVELGRNVLLINDGEAGFSNESAVRLPGVVHDSEDIAIEDFDGDGDLDIIVVSENDLVNEYYWNDGAGFFTDVSHLLAATGISNAVEWADLTGNGLADVLIGNEGQNVFLANDGAGGFVDETGSRLPRRGATTQDLELGDVDADGDLDIVVANEEANRLLLNDGTGVFTEAPDRIPPAPGEVTREAALGDIDGDGDLDLFFANVDFSGGGNLKNRLLVNDGDGTFSDETDSRLQPFRNNTIDADFVDVEGDGDLDLLLGSTSRLQLLLNDGAGVFVDATSALVAADAGAVVFDVESADYDGDGWLDIYIADFETSDRLLMGEARPIFWQFE